VPAARATIFDAIASRDLARVQRFLRRRPGAIAERNEQGLSPLMWALYHNEQEIADTILGRGATVDVFEAAALGDLRSLTRLLSRKRTRANAYSSDGFTPLHLAVFFGRSDAARLLLARGADVAAPSRNAALPSVQPLHSACAARRTDAAILLLDAGADPDAVTAGGWRPLHYAAVSGNIELARDLLSRGAAPQPLADDRSRPIDFAIEQGHTDVVALLRGRTRRAPRRALSQSRERAGT
jgi:ankyrin repeat protein